MLVLTANLDGSRQLWQHALLKEELARADTQRTDLRLGQVHSLASTAAANCTYHIKGMARIHQGREEA